MEPRVEFIITVDGISAQDFVNRLVHESQITTDDGMNFIFLKKLELDEAGIDQSIEVLLQDSTSIAAKPEGPENIEIQYEIEGFQKEYPEIDLQSWDWGMIPIGHMKVKAVDDGIQARCESDGEYSAELQAVAVWLLHVYGGQAHIV